MPRHLRRLVVFLYLILRGWTYAQEAYSPSPEYTRKQLEQAIEYALEDGYVSAEEAEDAFASIDDWLAFPRDVNRITAEELAEYRLLSPFQIYQFIRYRADHSGRIASLYDLKTITGWDESTAIVLAPLLTIGQSPAQSWRDGLDRGRLEAAMLHTRLRDKDEKSYLGPSYSLGLRGKYLAKDRLSVFLGAERDAYEPWRYGERVGFDSYTGHIAVEQIGILRKLVLGDYRCSWGDGLMLSQGFRLRPPYARGANTRELRPVQSLTEGERSRGVAADFEAGTWRLFILYSSQKLDGRIDDDGVVTGLSEAGLHRTESELERRQTVPMSHWGGMLSWGGDRFCLGMGFLRQSFSPYQIKHALGAKHITQLDSLMGQNLLSANYRWMSRTGAVRVTGEVARNTFGGWALAHQLGVSGGRFGDWQLAFRHISPTYWAYSGRAYTHTQRPNDEQGISIYGESRELLHRWLLSLGIDTYRRVSNPEQGIGLALRATAERKSRSGSYWRATLSLRHPRGGVSALRLGLQRHIELGRYSLTPYLALSRGSDEWGWAAALRGTLTANSRLNLWASLAAYRASWQGRIYLYEPRLRYQYGFTMLYGKGLRLSAGGLWQLSSRCALGLRAVYVPNSSEQMSNDSQISMAFYLK